MHLKTLQNYKKSSNNLAIVYRAHM